MHFYDGRNDKKVFPTNHTVSVVSCGASGVGDEYITMRKNGRVDWSLYYCATGTLYVEDVKLSQGEMWIYPPNVPQRYYAKAEDNNQYFYIHFTGSDVGGLLESLSIPTMKKIYEKMPLACFKKIQEFCPGGDMLSKISAEYYLMRILLLLAKKSVTHNVDTIRSVTEEMSHSFAQEYSPKKYADMLHISVDRFNHIFKEATGVSPYSYIISLRLENACALLSNTRLKISTVAESSGFDNPLYFTQLFKKRKGVTPSTYRKINSIL